MSEADDSNKPNLFRVFVGPATFVEAQEDLAGMVELVGAVQYKVEMRPEHARATFLDENGNSLHEAWRRHLPIEDNQPFGLLVELRGSNIALYLEECLPFSTHDAVGGFSAYDFKRAFAPERE